MDFNGANIANYTIAFLIDPKYGQLGPYSKAPGIYKCPADRSTVQHGRPDLQPRPQRRHEPGRRHHARRLRRARSSAPGSAATTATPQTPGAPTANSTDIVRPTPDMLWVITDEHPDSINDAGLGRRMRPHQCRGQDH